MRVLACRVGMAMGIGIGFAGCQSRVDPAMIEAVPYVAVQVFAESASVGWDATPTANVDVNYTLWVGTSPSVGPADAIFVIEASSRYVNVPSLVPGTEYWAVVTVQPPGTLPGPRSPRIAFTPFASTRPPVLSNWGWTPEPSSGTLGAALTSADLDRDGFDDVVIGDPRYNGPAGMNTGRVEIWRGAPDGIPILEAFWNGQTPGGELGGAVAVGNYYGDSDIDLAVGVPRGGNAERGQVLLFDQIPAGFPSAATDAFTTGQDGTRVGAALTADDFNDDGLQDLAASAPLYNGAAGADEGGVYSLLIQGTSPPFPTSPDVLEGGQLTAGFGASISSGDGDNDGFRDVLVGASDYTGIGLGEGAAFWFRGDGSGLLTAPQAILLGGQPGAGLGRAVLLADLGDGPRDEIIVGAPTYDGLDDADIGLVRVYRVPNSLSDPPELQWEAEGAAVGERYGRGLAVADVNGDLNPDLVVLAGTGDPSAMHVYYGTGDPATLPSTPDASVAIGSQGPIVVAGDINGDGSADLLVGEPFFSGGGGASVFMGPGVVGPLVSMAALSGPVGVERHAYVFIDPASQWQLAECGIDWGDGVVTQSNSPCDWVAFHDAARHTYTDPGTYEVKLTVVDGFGAAGTAMQRVVIE